MKIKKSVKIIFAYPQIIEWFEKNNQPMPKAAELKK
jgi:hypothetical protein